jgi:ATP-dependent Clp endopeptidase proteolytic subunit ClpP
MNRAKISIFNRVKGRSWYSIENKTDHAEVMIYDEIGIWGIEASQMVKEIKAITAKKITARLNTPGGSVFDGIAIANAFKDHPAEVDMHVDALAASIGSIIALAGDSVKMAKNAYFMIHNPWGLAIGDSAEMRKYADLLDKITGTLSETYTDRTGESAEQVKQWMDEETWFTAQEALDAGFVDEITGDTGAKAAFDLSFFAKTPENLKNEGGNPSIPTNKREYEAFLRDSGFSRSQATTLAAIFKEDQSDSDFSELIALSQKNNAILRGN